MKVTNNIPYYLVHWKGLTKAKSTWEEGTRLIQDGLQNEINDYHKSVKETNKKKRNRKKK